MKQSEFLETRSDEYLEAMESMQRGEIPPLFFRTRIEHPGVCNKVKPLDSWDKVVHCIRFIVNNRQDAKNTNSFHCPPRGTYKYYSKVLRAYYLKNIKVLDL